MRWLSIHINKMTLGRFSDAVHCLGADPSSSTLPGHLIVCAKSFEASGVCLNRIALPRFARAPTGLRFPSHAQSQSRTTVSGRVGRALPCGGPWQEFRSWLQVQSGLLYREPQGASDVRSTPRAPRRGISISPNELATALARAGALSRDRRWFRCFEVSGATEGDRERGTPRSR
jgi:hypothetical protein